MSATLLALPGAFFPFQMLGRYACFCPKFQFRVRWGLCANASGCRDVIAIHESPQRLHFFPQPSYFEFQYDAFDFLLDCMA
jgi:hypothetical protein